MNAIRINEPISEIFRINALIERKNERTNEKKKKQKNIVEWTKWMRISCSIAVVCVCCVWVFLFIFAQLESVAFYCMFCYAVDNRVCHQHYVNILFSESDSEIFSSKGNASKIFTYTLRLGSYRMRTYTKTWLIECSVCLIWLSTWNT